MGGSSGSWGTTTGSTPVLSGERCRARPIKGLNKSSSFSGAGGGSGLGWGRFGERRAGCAPRIAPPALLTGECDPDLSGPTLAPNGAVGALAAASGGREAGDDAVPSPSEWCSSCAVRAFEMSAAASSSSGDSGCDAGNSSALLGLGWCLDPLGRVRDPGVGCDFDGGCCCCSGGGSRGVVDSTGIEDVGDVLRLLGADDSITGQLRWESNHHEHYSRASTRLDGCDACQWETSQVLRALGACF